MCGSRVHTTLLPTKRVYIYFQHGKDLKHLNKGDKQVCCFYSATASSILSHLWWKLGYGEVNPEKDDGEEHDRWWSSDVRD